jgi:DNA-binding response OmpR family regulator
MNVSSEIWILEDDPMFQAAYRQAFASREGGVRFFSDLKSFLKALIAGIEGDVAEIPSGAILDLGLSDGNLAEEIAGSHSRALETFFRGVPCMVVSGVDDLQTLRLCFKAGIRDYLVKPFALSELLIKTERMIAESHIREAEAQTAGLLTPRERVILELLFETQEKGGIGCGGDGEIQAQSGAEPKGITKAEILKRVWPNVAVTEKSWKARTGKFAS